MVCQLRKEVDILDVCGNCKNFGNGCEVTDPDAPINDCNEWEENENIFYIPDAYIPDNEPVTNSGVNYIPKATSAPTDKPTSDHVNHPSHYTQGGIECIKAIEASMTPDGFQDYCKGNVLKYIWRWREKNGVEDLKKARVYLNWMIESAIVSELATLEAKLLKVKPDDNTGINTDTQESS